MINENRGRSKIVYISGATQLGGAERSLLDLVVTIQNNYQQIFDVLVIVPKDSGDLLIEFNKYNVKYCVIEFPKFLLRSSKNKFVTNVVSFILNLPSFLSYIVKIRRCLISENATIVHTNGIKIQIITFFLSFLFKAKYIWHLRDITNNNLFGCTLKIIYKIQRPLLIANSRYTLKSICSIDHEPNRVIYNGIDLKKFDKPKERYFNNLLKCGDDLIVIGILGVISRWKGQKEFVEMANVLLRKHRNLIFAVIGGEIYDTKVDNGFTQELVEYTKALNINDKFVFTGFVNNPEKYLTSLDILVHASIRPEPFGRVIVEAMAAHVPVIAANDGGVPEIISDGENGLLFSPSDVQDMALKVEKLIFDKTLCNKIVSNGFDSVRKKFYKEKHAEEVKNFYLENSKS